MRKIMLTIVLLSVALLSACAPTAQLKGTQEVFDAVTKNTGFQELTMMDRELSAMLLEVDESLLTDIAIGLDASRYTPEAVFIITAANDQDKKALETALQTYRDHLLAEYKDYRPQEAFKISDARVLTKGLQLALMIAPESGKAEEALNQAWK